MGTPARKPIPADAAAEAQARREVLRRRLAEQGVTLHVPADGAEWHPPQHPFPASGDEVSDAVLRMRRGDP
jgi:hypothetical protein